MPISQILHKHTRRFDQVSHFIFVNFPSLNLQLSKGIRSVILFNYDISPYITSLKMFKLLLKINKSYKIKRFSYSLKNNIPLYNIPNESKTRTPKIINT